MSAVVAHDPSKSAAKKKKKTRKKANASKSDTAVAGQVNGAPNDDGEDEGEDNVEDPETPVTTVCWLPCDVLSEDEADSRVKQLSPAQQLQQEDSLHMPSSPPEPSSLQDRTQSTSLRNGSRQIPESSTDATEDEEDQPSAPETADSSARLDALQAERDSLRSEVTQLRKELEGLQSKHEEELSGVKEELEEAQQGKEDADEQYRNLLGKVNTIRSQLGERLKADAAELERARERIEELESGNNTAKTDNERLQQTIIESNERIQEQGKEIEQLRSRTNLSTSNWAKERDDLVQREAYVREEYEEARQAMQDWEILATEERSRREHLEEKVQELEDQLGTQREAYERIKGDADTQGNAVEGLQRALQEIQETRKRELREQVEQSQTQLDELKKQTKSAEDAAASLRQEIETTQKELERALPFEKEVKEKNLLIGKLRHEAVILNDHLTKALRFLKRGRPEDNVDRQLVTNHFIHFLQLDRSDPKKFQILQLIAALLGWDEQQKEQAGLLRTGQGGYGSLRVPVSPFRRTPSTPSLGADFIPDSPGGASRESLAELWSDFLAREAEAGGGSRRGSVASGGLSLKGMRSPSMQSGITSPVGGRPGPELARKESESSTATGGRTPTEQKDRS